MKTALKLAPSVFLVIATVLFFLLIGHDFFLWQILALADLVSMLAVTSLPIVILVMRQTHKDKGYIGEAILVAGVLLLLHLTLTALLIEWRLRQPFTWDLVPFPGQLRFTLNCSIPLAVMGFLIGLYFKKRLLRIWTLWIGGALLAVGTLAFIWYGHYFFGKLMTDSLADSVWWL